MAILAAAMLPLLALQGQFIRSVESFERADTRIAARQNAVAYLKTLNFTQVETGRVVQGEIVLRWIAEPALATRRTRWPGGEVGRYELTLYSIEAILEFPDGNEDRFSVNGLGWRPKWSIADVF
ncbi:MAG: hypothetical protein COA47_16445 [Robiginitomaculum sp.]|nr:MAG: hypothetical protein COA47_16445 [Robiginitomaculum sp.]